MKSKISSALSVAGFALLTPFVSVFAQTTFGTNNVFENALVFVKRIMTTLFPIVTAGLILTFGYLVFKFLTDKELEAKEVHKGALIKALFAIFLWFTLFGLIGLLANAVGVEVGKDVGTDDITQVAL
jgi:uncharacterized protein with PQ loop repeat